MDTAFPLSDEVSEFMSDMQPCPLAAVPKKNPAALLATGDWRIVHDHGTVDDWALAEKLVYWDVGASVLVFLLMNFVALNSRR